MYVSVMQPSWIAASGWSPLTLLQQLADLCSISYMYVSVMQPTWIAASGMQPTNYTAAASGTLQHQLHLHQCNAALWLEASGFQIQTALNSKSCKCSQLLQLICHWLAGVQIPIAVKSKSCKSQAVVAINLPLVGRGSNPNCSKIQLLQVAGSCSN